MKVNKMSCLLLIPLCMGMVACGAYFPYAGNYGYPASYGNGGLQQQFLQSYGNHVWANQGYYQNAGTVATPASSSSSTSTPVSSSSTSQRSCGLCHGTGKCNICNGRGLVTRIGMGSGTSPCASCSNHDGLCTLCRGTGKAN